MRKIHQIQLTLAEAEAIETTRQIMSELEGFGLAYKYTTDDLDAIYHLSIDDLPHCALCVGEQNLELLEQTIKPISSRDFSKIETLAQKIQVIEKMDKECDSIDETINMIKDNPTLVIEFLLDKLEEYIG